MSIQEILKLPVDKRLSLMEKIWDSIDPKEVEVSNTQKKEIDYRLAADKAGKMSWQTWEEVKEYLNSRKK